MKSNSSKLRISKSMLRGAVAGLLVATQAVAGTQSASASNAPSLDAITKSGTKVGTALMNRDGDLVIAWAGQIMPGMASFIDRAFVKYGTDARYVHLLIDSAGGSVAEGESVIRSLRRIKKTHQLHTRVRQGSKCFSMCVPIFLQGKNRVAAGSSVWVFHDVSRQATDGKRQYDRQETVRLFQRYFVEAGVSVAWINRMLPEIRNADLWQTGRELIEAKSGIITHVLSNKTARR